MRMGQFDSVEKRLRFETAVPQRFNHSTDAALYIKAGCWMPRKMRRIFTGAELFIRRKIPYGFSGRAQSLRAPPEIQFS